MSCRNSVGGVLLCQQNSRCATANERGQRTAGPVKSHLATTAFATGVAGFLAIVGEVARIGIHLSVAFRLVFVLAGLAALLGAQGCCSSSSCSPGASISSSVGSSSFPAATCRSSADACAAPAIPAADFLDLGCSAFDLSSTVRAFLLGCASLPPRRVPVVQRMEPRSWLKKIRHTANFRPRCTFRHQFTAGGVYVERSRATAGCS